MRYYATLPVDSSSIHTFMPSPAVLVQYALYWLSPGVSAALAAIVEHRGFIGSGDSLARRLGISNRHVLNRLLRADGLPPCTKLAAWIRVLCWVAEFENSGASLSRQALAAGRDPAVYSRTVRRVTGWDWRAVRLRGSIWVLLELLDHCVEPSRLTSAANAS